ncbi:MAG: tripartite tricarboxylate transporter permease, partial [Candidatus Woesearchaeota archaeon]|nr:tripartite tricarboxylate transporter permease [Candidatus Woesearchaeota archaeon]
MIDRFLAVIGGIITGIITGILPGVHPNLIATLTMATSTEPLLAATFLTAMAGTNTIAESISTAFLAPDPDKAGSACQQFLKDRKAPDAARLLILGGTTGTAISMGTLFVVLPLIKQTYTIIRPVLGILLTLMSLFFILNEQTIQKKMWAAVIAISSGTLGWIVLNNPFPEPLFLLLTGMYAIPTLLQKSIGKQKIPTQHTETIT